MPDGPNRQQAQMDAAAAHQDRRPRDAGARPAGAARALPAPGQVSAAAAAMPDPNVLYSEAVKGALVEAMLDYSLQMNLGPEEWLTVAARASEGPMPPAGLSDLITIVLRVKGSDLSVYHADPTKRDEIRQRVKVEARVF